MKPYTYTPHKFSSIQIFILFSYNRLLFFTVIDAITFISSIISVSMLPLFLFFFMVPSSSPYIFLLGVHALVFSCLNYTTRVCIEPTRLTIMTSRFDWWPRKDYLPPVCVTSDLLCHLWLQLLLLLYHHSCQTSDPPFNLHFCVGFYLWLSRIKIL